MTDRGQLELVKLASPPHQTCLFLSPQNASSRPGNEGGEVSGYKQQKELSSLWKHPAWILTFAQRAESSDLHCTKSRLSVGGTIHLENPLSCQLIPRMGGVNCRPDCIAQYTLQLDAHFTAQCTIHYAALFWLCNWNGIIRDNLSFSAVTINAWELFRYLGGLGLSFISLYSMGIKLF